jgi:hypothetical protein
MILFYGEGRFGNQLFQYQALSHIARGQERIIAAGLEDLEQHFELNGPKVAVLTRQGLIKRAVKYLLLPFVLRPLARLGLLNYVHELQSGTPPHHGNSGRLCRRNGLLRHITFVDGGYYHNASLWSSLFPLRSSVVNPSLRKAARQYLDSVCGAGLRPTFIHIRRGDYLSYKAYGVSDLTLPLEFYQRALAELERLIGKRPLVFVTDDPQWVQERFREIPDKVIPAFDAPMDFAIMTECGSGILSNSTFSLAAALMMQKPELIVAPRFWFGFRVNRWLPPAIEVAHEKLLYLPVLQASSPP